MPKNLRRWTIPVRIIKVIAAWRGSIRARWRPPPFSAPWSFCRHRSRWRGWPPSLGPCRPCPKMMGDDCHTPCTLWQFGTVCYILKMAMDIVDLPIKKCDVPCFFFKYVYQREKIALWAFESSTLGWPNSQTNPCPLVQSWQKHDGNSTDPLKHDGDKRHVMADG